jgi:phenylalanyl-tRNA synthetase beta chain
MRVSVSWLKEWVDTGLSAAELADRLTMAGLEVDAIESAAPEFEGVVVGHVTAVEPHPDADKLSVCTVDDGSGDYFPVVCGATNVHQGMRAPYARVGAVLPDGTKIRKAKLRGVESRGMLCSPKELALADDADGLMPLPSDAPPGQDLRDYLALDDQILEIDLTPNRADCLGMAGIARELGVLLERPVKAPVIRPVTVTASTRRGVTVDQAEDCPVYAGRVIEGIDPMAESPLWLRERLRRAGLRPISPVVDVTNYVMIELGQPMHGFDLDRLKGDIHVRRAKPGEKLVLLDGDEAKLDPDILVIADGSGPVAMAGIMGGERSGVTPASRNVFLESACFAPLAIAGRPRRFGLHTDSSHRFERGVDPELQGRALDRASALILEIAGGKAGPVTLVRGRRKAVPAIGLRRDRLDSMLGVSLPKGEVGGILKRLGLEVKPDRKGWQARPPSFRPDLRIEEDLIEEIARVHGYADIPVADLPAGTRPGRAPEDRADSDSLASVLVERGYQEAITYSFVAPAEEAAFSGRDDALRLANPISSELAVMRTSLWPGLAAALRHNVNRQQRRVRFFEIGLRYILQDDELKQEKMIAGLACGAALPEQWDHDGRRVDFFDLKADVQALADASGGGEIVCQTAGHSSLHPGQSARLMLAGEPAGWLGRIHPRLAERLDLPEETVLFELRMDVVGRGRVPAYRTVSRYPSIRRDLAVVVEETVAVAELLTVSQEAGGEILQDVVIFDVYRGKGIEAGRKSIAFGLILQDSSRTLTDEEVDTVVGRVQARLHERFGASIRD